MPEVFLDGARIDFEARGGKATVGELLRAIESGMAGSRRFVMELWVDGEKRDDWRESALLDDPLSRYTDLSLKTVSIESLALEGIDVVEDYIRVIKENIGDCVRCIRTSGRILEPALSGVLEGITEVVRTIDALTKGVEKYSIDLFRENPVLYFKPLLRCLENLTELANNDDTVLLADSLEYELAPILTDMSDRIFYKADG